MAIDPAQLTDLTETDLKGLIRAAEQALQQQVARRARSTLKEVRRLAAEVGYEATFTKAAKPGGKGRPPSPRGPARRKYRNPDNPAETWAGRGRPPKWVEQALAAGGSLEDLAIPEPGGAV